jgi:predicted metal-dependent hydrolase
MLGINSGKSFAKKFEPLEFYGKMLDVEIVEANKIRNGYASVKNGRVLIRVPKHCNMRSKERMVEELYTKISISLKRRPQSFVSNAPLKFYDGEKIAPNGEELVVEVRNSAYKHSSSRVRGGKVIVSIGADKKDISELASKAIARHFEGYIESNVKLWNERFKSELGSIRISRGLTIWGSCSPKNNITINLRLLFIDKKFLDYVVVHELSHTKVRSHSKRFWRIVEKYIPEYRKIRRELKLVGAVIDTEANLQNQAIKPAEVEANQTPEQNVLLNMEKKSAPTGEGQRTLENFS